MMSEINNRGYTLNLRVQLDTPSGSDCFVIGHSRSYSRAISFGETTTSAILSDIRDMESGAAKYLAYQLTEGWVLRGELSDEQRRERARRMSALVEEAGLGMVQDDAACD